MKTDNLFQNQLNKKLLNWHILVPDHALYATFPNHVPSKNFWHTSIRNLKYSWNITGSGTRMGQFNNFLSDGIWQRSAIYVNSTKLIDSTMTYNKKVNKIQCNDCTIVYDFFALVSLLFFLDLMIWRHLLCMMHSTLLSDKVVNMDTYCRHTVKAIISK